METERRGSHKMAVIARCRVVVPSIAAGVTGSTTGWLIGAVAGPFIVFISYWRMYSTGRFGAEDLGVFYP